MIQWKLADGISLNFPELFIIRKYVKMRFKNRGSSCYFLPVKRSKILQKLSNWEREREIERQRQKDRETERQTETETDRHRESIDRISIGNLLRFFSGKTKSSEKISLVESDRTFTKDAKNAGNLNTFFAKVVKNLNYPRVWRGQPLWWKTITSHIERGIFKYSKQLIIIAVNWLDVSRDKRRVCLVIYLLLS